MRCGARPADEHEVRRGRSGRRRSRTGRGGRAACLWRVQPGKRQRSPSTAPSSSRSSALISGVRPRSKRRRSAAVAGRRRKQAAAAGQGPHDRAQAVGGSSSPSVRRAQPDSGSSWAVGCAASAAGGVGSGGRARCAGRPGPARAARRRRSAAGGSGAGRAGGGGGSAGRCRAALAVPVGGAARCRCSGGSAVPVGGVTRRLGARVCGGRRPGAVPARCGRVGPARRRVRVQVLVTRSSAAGT